jgi:hypothetical protein
MEEETNISIITRILFFWYIAIFISTESLSYFNFINRSSILLVNSLFFVAILLFYGKKLKKIFKSFLQERNIYLYIIFAILSLTFLQGFLSAPNTTDSMVRRLPIMMYWVQEHTLFQDVIRNGHDFMGPFSEYIFLHLYLIFDGDRMLFFSQWAAFVVVILLSFLIARNLSKSKKIALYISLLVATLPIAVLQATSVQMDMVTTVLVLFSLYFALIFKEKPNMRNALLLGFAIGLGILTKATFLIYIIFPVGILFPLVLRRLKNLILPLLLIAVIIGLIQARFIDQNLRLFGSVSGERGKSVYMNELITPQIIFSNVIRNLTVQLPFPIGGELIKQGIINIHNQIGINVNDPRINFFDSKFSVNPIIFPQEDKAGNPIHLIIIILGGILLILRKSKLKDLPSIVNLYILSITSLILFSAILKWQPFHSRLLMPFFIIGSIASIVILMQFKRLKVLLNLALMASVGLSFVLIVFNVSKPFISYNFFYASVKGLAPRLSAAPESIFTKKREEQYFNARYYWYMPYREITKKIRGEEGGTIAFKLMDEFEYPLWYFLRKNELSLKVIPYSKKTRETIIISTAESPSSTEGYSAECIKTEIKYGYACLLLPEKSN